MIAARRGAALTGFVSYMRRTDAERAISEFDGFNWGGHVLRIGWSKAIPTPSKALFGELYDVSLCAAEPDCLQRGLVDHTRRIRRGIAWVLEALILREGYDPDPLHRRPRW